MSDSAAIVVGALLLLWWAGRRSTTEEEPGPEQPGSKMERSPASAGASSAESPGAASSDRLIAPSTGIHRDATGEPTSYVIDATLPRAPVQIAQLDGRVATLGADVPPWYVLRDELPGGTMAPWYLRPTPSGLRLEVEGRALGEWGAAGLDAASENVYGARRDVRVGARVTARTVAETLGRIGYMPPIGRGSVRWEPSEGTAPSSALGAVERSPDSDQRGVDYQRRAGFWWRPGYRAGLSPEQLRAAGPAAIWLRADTRLASARWISVRAGATDEMGSAAARAAGARNFSWVRSDRALVYVSQYGWCAYSLDGLDQIEDPRLYLLDSATGRKYYLEEERRRTDHSLQSLSAGNPAVRALLEGGDDWDVVMGADVYLSDGFGAWIGANGTMGRGPVSGRHGSPLELRAGDRVVHTLQSSSGYAPPERVVEAGIALRDLTYRRAAAVLGERALCLSRVATVDGCAPRAPTKAPKRLLDPGYSDAAFAARLEAYDRAQRRAAAAELVARRGAA